MNVVSVASLLDSHYALCLLSELFGMLEPLACLMWQDFTGEHVEPKQDYYYSIPLKIQVWSLQ